MMLVLKTYIQVIYDIDGVQIDGMTKILCKSICRA